jgi:hypothetical protein
MNPDNPAHCRATYRLLIVVAAAMVLGRIMAVNLVYEPYLHKDDRDPASTGRVWPKFRPKPTLLFSSNDRSRWATIRALVENGTYSIGQRTLDPNQPKGYRDEGIIFEDGWTSVDKVMDPQTGKFYSSKPTLFPTLVAALYGVLYHVFGLSLSDNMGWVVRLVLLLVNWLPLIGYWLVLAQLVERFGRTEWGKLYVVAAGCFGTFLTTFAITLNNHTVAACTALFALHYVIRIWSEESRPLSDYFLAGLFAALTTACELPALSFLVGLFVLLLWRAPWPTLLGFVPPMLVIVAASFLTNYLAIGRLTPAYAELGKKSEWYMYEGSHWKELPGQEKRGIDFASRRENRAQYGFHFLLGHHGVFSLSPMFLFSMVGMVLIWRHRKNTNPRAALPPQSPAAELPLESAVRTADLAGSVTIPGSDSSSPGQNGEKEGEKLKNESGKSDPDREFLVLAGLTAYLTVVVVGFYLAVSNNYGGWTCGPRWLFWLTPFWLLTMLPVVDRLGTTGRGRALALVFLAISVASVSFPAWNPWRHPWLYQFMEAQGWIAY